MKMKIQTGFMAKVAREDGTAEASSGDRATWRHGWAKNVVNVYSKHYKEKGYRQRT
jgi:hypothetical protein